jgi:hypothetical protein
MSSEASNAVFRLLPGPDRKRSESSYSYQLVFRNPREKEAGCVMLWQVVGGRMPYQIALERDSRNNLRFHCTCADAVFRCEGENRFCKHVRGLLEFNRSADQAALPA